MANFNISVEKTILNEGGYTNNVSDPGGETKYGISQRSYPELNISQLTLDDARAIYRRDFWNPLYDQLASQEVADELFDFGVNVGVRVAVRIFQESVRYVSNSPVSVDGEFGPATLAAANAADVSALLRELRARESYYYALIVIRHPTASAGQKLQFLLGWLRRVMA